MSDSPPAGETQAGDDLLGELADDFLRRHRAGERPTVDDYAARHPTLADRIRDLFPAMLAMELSGAGAPLDPAPPTERIGATVGRYKLLERIGEGGFGVVYMAEQQQPVRRRVALKLVKPGMDSRQVLARFDAERQALAIMDHPNIARVFDAGATETGRPYFVMELVKGEPITEFCDRSQFSPRQRLELFAQVCQAVQHAHQKGIIHRDIKPTNVLVMMHDTTPVVKVIDFGVAKALGQELTEKTLFTGFAQLVGTPLYMSPEQAGQSALDVDTRSDIYSLGVLLYELLTGTTPFDKERFKKAAQDEIRRIIREEEPPRPSTRLSESKDSLASISALRHMEPAKLTRLVRGELDWIVMKALEKDRRRRYETVNGFAADVLRYLADEPVLACPPSTAYRLRKFLRRNKGPVAAATAILLLLIAGIAVSTWQAIRIRAEERNTLAQKQDADRQRDDANRQRQAAQTNERLAEVRLAEGLVSAGDALLTSREVLRARVAYRQSLDISQKLGLWPVPATSGLMQSYIDSPAWLMSCPEAEGHRKVAFSPDGRTLASNQRDAVRLYDVLTGVKKKELRGHEYGSFAVTFSHDGRLLLTTGQDGTARIWDVVQGKELHCVRGATGSVMSGAFSPDDRLAITGGSDGRIRITDVASGQLIRVISPNAGSIWSLGLSPDGTRVACGGVEGRLKLCDVGSGAEVLTIRPERGQINWVGFTPDGTGVLTAHWSRTMHLWSVADGREIRQFGPTEGNVRDGTFSHDGATLLSTGDDGSLRQWDVATGTELRCFAVSSDSMPGLALSPDQRLVATQTLLWDLAGQADMRRFPAHERGIIRIESAPDGRLVLTADAGGVLKLWDTATWRCLRTLVGHAGTIQSIAFLPDGLRAISTGVDGVVKQWDLITGKQVNLRTGITRTGVTSGAAISPDGRTAALETAEGTMLVDLTSTSTVRTLEVTQSAKAIASNDLIRGISAAFSPDGTKVLVGYTGSAGTIGNIAVLWDVESGREIRTLSGHRHWVSAVTFSPDGRRALTGSWDSSVIVWDVETGKPLHVLNGHTGRVFHVAFAPDGRTGLSAAADGTARLWDLEAGRQIRLLARDPTGMSATFLPDGNTVVCGTGGTLSLYRLDWPILLRDRGVRLRQAQDALAQNPSNGSALSEIAEWYVFRGKWDWAVELLERAQASGKSVSPLTLARCYLQLGRTSDAQVQFGLATKAGEAPSGYLTLCSTTVTPGRQPTTAEAILENLQEGPSAAYLDAATGEAYRLRARDQLDEAITLRMAVVAAARRLWPEGFPLRVRHELDCADLLIYGQRHSDGCDIAAKALQSAILPEQRSRALKLIGAGSSAGGLHAYDDLLKSTAQPASNLSWRPTTVPFAWNDELLKAARAEAAIRRKAGFPEEALSLQRYVVQASKELSPQQGQRIRAAQRTLASLLTELKCYYEAETELIDIYSACKTAEAAGTPGAARELPTILRDLANVYDLTGKSESATNCRKMAESLEPGATTVAAVALPATLPSLLGAGASSRPTSPGVVVNDPAHAPSSLDEMNRQAYVLRRDGKLDEARVVRGQVIEFAKTLYSKGDPRLVKYQHDYAQLLIQMQRHEEAEVVAREAVESLAPGETTWRLKVLRSLVQLYEQWEKPDHATRYRKLLAPVEATTRAATMPTG